MQVKGVRNELVSEEDGFELCRIPVKEGERPGTVIRIDICNVYEIGDATVDGGVDLIIVP